MIEKFPKKRLSWSYTQNCYNWKTERRQNFAKESSDLWSWVKTKRNGGLVHVSWLQHSEYEMRTFCRPCLMLCKRECKTRIRPTCKSPAPTNSSTHSERRGWSKLENQKQLSSCKLSFEFWRQFLFYNMNQLRRGKVIMFCNIMGCSGLWSTRLAGGAHENSRGEDVGLFLLWKEIYYEIFPEKAQKASHRQAYKFLKFIL